MGAGPGPGGGTNPRPRSARNRRPSGAGSGARQGWRRGTAGALEAATVGQGPVGAGRGSDGVGERASVGAMHRRGRQLFAQAGKHRRNALLQRFDELLVHFEHLMQIGRRSIFHVIARASGAGHGELRCQSGGNIVGGNFIPMAGDGKQANRCRAPWLWARNGLSRSAQVSESRRTSVHHDTARGYRDHGFKCELPFARANRICTKRHSNPLSAWSKCHPIVCSGADAVSSPCVRLNTRSMHTPLVWARLCMTSDAAWDAKAYFGSGRAPACDPMSNSPPARKRRCRKLLFCPSTAQKTEASRALDFRFRLRFSSRNRHRAKRRKLPAHIAPLRAALTCLVLSKVGTSE